MKRTALSLVIALIVGCVAGQATLEMVRGLEVRLRTALGYPVPPETAAAPPSPAATPGS
jgi:hypothetical protein